MKHRHDAHGLACITNLIDQTVGSDPQRPQPFESPSQSLPRFRLGLQSSDSIEDGFGKTYVQFVDVSPSGSGKDDARQRLPPSRPPGLFAGRLDLFQRRRSPSLEVRKPSLDRSNGRGIRKYLGGLFQSFVLVDWD